jgi:hypothetical protein
MTQHPEPGLLDQALARTSGRHPLVEDRADPDWEKQAQFWKTKAEDAEAVLGFLCSLAFRRPDFQVFQPGDGPSHPEDPKVILVRDPNSRNQWREVHIGFDSDVSQLAGKIYAWLDQDDRSMTDRTVAISEELAAAEDGSDG